jgi:hypothetical protein
MERLDLKSLFQKSLKVLRDQIKTWTVIPAWGVGLGLFLWPCIRAMHPGHASGPCIRAKTKTSARGEVCFQRGLLSGGVDRRGWRRS